jgi:outer membrane receptor for ferrienterochelin and colicin
MSICSCEKKHSDNKRLAALILLLPLTAFANENDQDYTQMSLKELMSLEVFTAASLLPTEIKKAPGTVYSFSRKDFKRLGVRRVDELLEFVPGFQLNQYRKRHRFIWSRGIISRYNNKMKLLVDGVPIQHTYYGHFSGGENLPLEIVEKVEVIIGPSSSLYGANAFAGVVSVVTRNFAGSSSSPYVETSFEAGNHSRSKGTAFYNSQSLQGFVSYLDQDAPFDSDRKSFIGGDVTQPLDERYQNVFIKGALFEDLTVSLDYKKNETPFVFMPDTTHSNAVEEFFNLSMHYETGDVESGRLETIAYYVDDNARETEYETGTGQLAYRESRDSVYYGLKLTWFKQMFTDHTVAIGLEWQHDEAKDMDNIRNWHFSRGFIVTPVQGSLLSNPDEENDDYALFVQNVWQINSDLTATFGLRYDSFEQFDDDVNGRLALVYTINEQQTLKMLWGTGSRKPTYREYLKVLENTTFVAPVPETEQMETFELGYAYQWQNANINVTAFYNEFEDYLVETPTPDGNDEYFINSDSAWRMHGVELLSEYRISSQLSFRMTAAWLNAQERGDDIPYLSEWTASLFAEYQWIKKHYVSLSALYNSDKEDTNDNNYTDDEPDSYTIVNFQARGDLTENFSYQLGVRNLTDKEIYDPAGDFDDRYNNLHTEREVWGKLTWSWRF